MSFRIMSPFRELPNEILWEHYDNEYGYLNVAEKTILDIGADVGTSSDYWLQHGAAKIFAIEGYKPSYDQLIKNIEEQHWENIITPEQMWICDTAQFSYLLNKYGYADICKIDCEGCEKYWLELEDEVISIPNIYIIEFHRQEYLEKGTERLLKLGYILENRVEVTYDVCVVLFRKQGKASLFNSVYSKTKIIFKDLCH